MDTTPSLLFDEQRLLADARRLLASAPVEEAISLELTAYGRVTAELAQLASWVPLGAHYLAAWVPAEKRRAIADSINLQRRGPVSVWHGRDAERVVENLTPKTPVRQPPPAPASAQWHAR